MRIGEVSRAVGVAPGTLRAWEEHGLVRPVRSESGTRYYGPEDVARIKSVKKLRTENNFNLAAVRKTLGLANQSYPRNSKTAPVMRIGADLRQRRLKQGKTLADLSARTGLSVSFLSALERGTRGASLASLSLLTEAYGPKKHERPDFAPALDPSWPHVELNRGTGADGVRCRSLVLCNSRIRPNLLLMPPRSEGRHCGPHVAEAFLYVFAGTLYVELMDLSTYQLRTNDSLCSSRVRRWWTETEETRLMYIAYIEAAGS